jgi:hypothetical protein
MFFPIDVIHGTPLSEISIQSRTSAGAAVIIEFSRAGDNCFGRVKAAIENKIVMKPSARAGQRRAVAAKLFAAGDLRALQSRGSRDLIGRAR